MGSTPYAPVDEDATFNNYPAIIVNYDRLGEERLGTFNQLDVRIDKKWNFRKVSLNVYLEVQNVLNQNAPGPPEYGLDRTGQGEIIEPRSLVQLPPDESATLPILGIVLDF